MRARLAGFADPAQALQLRRDVLLAAVRADPVGELSVGMSLDVGLDLLPVISVVPDLLAVGADWQESLELLDPRQRLLELAHPIGERGLQGEHPEAHLHTRV